MFKAFDEYLENRLFFSFFKFFIEKNDLKRNFSKIQINLKKNSNRFEFMLYLK